MLNVIATPIGNLDDLTPRALMALKTAELIACEDTRRTWQLLTHFGIPRPEMVSYRQGNEERVAERIVAAAKEGRRVALCSDGGYPGISDPGYRLIRECVRQQVRFEVLPGASAVNVALLASGLSTSSFTFRGFPPRGPGALRNWFLADADKPHTLICFESPYRVGDTLQAALETLGDREAAVCIELTKLHERVHRGYLADLAAEFADGKVKGEVAIVIAGNNPKFIRRRGEEQGESAAAATGEYELSGIETIARGVCIRDGKALLCRGKGLGSTYLPGGHIEFGEKGRDALVREMREETGLSATAGELLATVENAFMQHGKRHCEINLVYRMTLAGGADVGSREDWIGFEWCDADKLDEANLLPESMREIVKAAAGKPARG